MKKPQKSQKKITTKRVKEAVKVLSRNNRTWHYVSFYAFGTDQEIESAMDKMTGGLHRPPSMMRVTPMFPKLAALK